jgi:DNA mismatch repair protein MSH6
LKAVRVIAELDCLVSLAKASTGMDEPKCRPTFIDTPEAFIDFTELRHPSMCLRSSFISNNVQLGGNAARQVLLTGPNMAGKSTLLRMTAAGVILAQLGCYVPAESARLSPIDRIQTRMGAYDSGSSFTSGE